MKIIFGDKMYSKRCARDKGLKTLLITLRKIGYTVGVPHNTKIDRIIYWSAKRTYKFPELYDKKIILEHGWIPRHTYQISNMGSNSQGHYAKNYQYTPLTEDERHYTLNYINNLLIQYKQSIRPEAVKLWKERIKKPFILFPFQSAGDFNLKYATTPFKKFFNRKYNKNKEFAQGCIDYMKKYNLPYQLVYKQHPSDNSELKNKLQNLDAILITKQNGVTTHELFATGLCKGVISINSNTIHEALVWNIPVICLDTLIWNDKTNPRPLSKDIKEIGERININPLENDVILAYLYYLIKNQWTLTDLKNPEMVKKLIESQGTVEPLSLRKVL